MRRIHIAVLVAAAFGACDDGVQSPRERDPNVLFSGGLTPSGSSLFGVIHCVNYVSATDSQDVMFVNALIGGDSTADSVWFEDIYLPQTITSKDSASRVYQRSYTTNSSPFALDGSYYTFTVGGNWGGGSFADSLRSPTSRVTITSPDYGDTVSASGFAATWVPSGGKAIIWLRDTAEGEHSCSTRLIETNTGTATLSSSDLSCLASGPIWLTVTAGNAKVDSTGSGAYYSIVMRSEMRIRLYLD